MKHKDVNNLRVGDWVVHKYKKEVMFKIVEFDYDFNFAYDINDGYWFVENLELSKRHIVLEIIKDL